MIRVKKRIKSFFFTIWTLIRLPEMTMLPGVLAFFFVLSVVPIITLIGYGAALLNQSMDFLSDFITQAFSPAVSSMIFPPMNEINLGFNFFISLIVGFFIASNGADAIVLSSNAIYGIKNKGYIRRRAKALVMTVLIVILFLFILVVPVFGNKIMELIGTVNLNDTVTRNIQAIYFVLKGAISWFIMFFFIKIIYTMAPEKKIASSTVNYGAVFTTVLWMSITYLYSYYINHFANMAPIYGGLANIVILMLWVYILATVFVIGMAMNYKKETLSKNGKIKKNN